MSERNAHVPFPELLASGTTLEGLVVDMAHGKLIPFSQLPDTISSKNIEVYANWVLDLTQNDSAHAERGVVLHVRADNDGIIYPSNPNVGDERGTGWVVSKNRTKFIPTINIHTHLIDVCHSPALADMGTLISGFGKNDDRFMPISMLVATPAHNYLMLKSHETPTEEDKWAVYDKGYEMFDQDAYNRFRRFGNQVGQLMDRNHYWQVFERAEKLLGMPFDDYYGNFVHAINLAEAYNIGFYRSNRDRNYIRLTRSMVMEQVTHRFDEILSAALKSALPQQQGIHKSSGL